MPNKVNYNNEMNKELKAIGEDKKTLLLHTCCAPCGSACLERIRDDLDTTAFYYNPNITNVMEYKKRYEELSRLVDEYNKNLDRNHIRVMEGQYDPKTFLDLSIGFEDCPERGERCTRCYELRLRETAKVAAREGYDYFSTTLTLSPLKDVERLNSIGQKIADDLKDSAESKTTTPKWLPSDFKKEGGYQRSIELSKEYDLYRQDYCGCAFSKAERERKRQTTDISNERNVNDKKIEARH